MTMTPQKVFEFVDDAKQFFEKYEILLKDRSQNIDSHEEIEETGDITFWITSIVKENVESIIGKLKRFEANIPLKPVIEIFTYADLINAIIGRRSPPRADDEQTLSESENGMLEKHLTSTIDYLFRAKEMLTLQVEEADYYAEFIPTKYFLEQQQKTRQVLDHCLEIFQKHKDLIPSNYIQKKSWLIKELHLGIIMNQIQRVAFGLSDNLIKYFKDHDLDTSKIQPNHKDKAKAALKVIVEKMDNLSSLTPTKKTQKLLVCQDKEFIPTHEIHFKYIPRGTLDSLKKAKELIKSDPNITALSVLQQARKPKRIG